MAEETETRTTLPKERTVVRLMGVMAFQAGAFRNRRMSMLCLKLLLTVTPETKRCPIGFELHTVRRLMHIVAIQARALGHRGMNYLFACLAFVANLAQFGPLANQAESPGLLRMIQAGWIMARDTIIGTHRAMHEHFTDLALVTAGIATVRHSWQRRSTGEAACQQKPNGGCAYVK